MNDIGSTVRFLLNDVISFHEALKHAFSMKSGIHDLRLLGVGDQYAFS